MPRQALALETNYESTRLDVDQQQTLNYYPHSLRGYRQFPGLVEFASFLDDTEALNDNASDPLVASDGPLTVSVVPGGNDRGAITMNGTLYVVSGPSLFSVNVSGVQTFIGTIANDPMPVVMDTSGTEIVITTGSTAYQYTESGGLTEITDTDLETAWTNAYVDLRFAYDQPSGQFVVSDLNNPDSINALNFATAESFNDDLLRVFTHNQLLYLFGKESTEMWYTSGVGRPPLDRQAVSKRGLAGRYAVAETDDQIYFIDDTFRPARFAGTQYMPLVVSSALGEEWASYSAEAFANARVQTYTINQENFIDFIFPTISKCWTFYEPKQSFFEKTFKTTTVIRVYNKTLAVDYTAGKLYELSGNQQDGSTVTYRKDSALVTSEVFGSQGQDMVLDVLDLTIQASSATPVLVYFSKDLTTFTNPRTFTVPAGNSKKRLTSFGKFHEGIFRIEHSADASIEVLDMAAEVDFVDG